MNRREYLQKFVLGGTVLFLTPSVLESCTKDSQQPDNQLPSGGAVTIDLSLPNNSILNTQGGSKIVQSILVINLGSGFVALSSICTHQGCTVGFNSTANKIQCPCHGSEFSVTGNVLQGPASAPLQSFQVKQTGNVLEITT